MQTLMIKHPIKLLCSNVVFLGPGRAHFWSRVGGTLAVILAPKAKYLSPNAELFVPEGEIFVPER